MTFYTAFITKEYFQIFGEMVQKVLKMRKCNLFLVEDIYPTAVYARSVSLLAYPTVVYARSI